jgi:hypothetical protein
VLLSAEAEPEYEDRGIRGGWSGPGPGAWVDSMEVRVGTGRDNELRMLAMAAGAASASTLPETGVPRAATEDEPSTGLVWQQDCCIAELER